MRYAVLSDVHANIEALDAVIRDIDLRKIEDVYFLGDAVGYGPNPNECVEILRERCKALIAGNHDWGAIGLTDISYFNANARYAVEWTTGVMTEKNKKILKSLPVRQEMKAMDILLVHSTPREPEAWHYLLTLRDAEMNFHYFDSSVCFLGHSHLPFIVEKYPSGDLVTYKEAAGIKKGSRYIVNAGSVGQPRDGDPRACYAVVDDEGIGIVRVPYDIPGVQNKMRREHLPAALVERLRIGR
jgi:predicted phosphodiesterase